MVSYFYVIDDTSLVSLEGYTSQKLSHEEAKEKLRGKNWHWHIKVQEGDTYGHLEDLARLSGVLSDLDADNLKQREEVDPLRLRVGTGHTYLLLRGDKNHELFTPSPKKRSSNKKPRVAFKNR